MTKNYMRILTLVNLGVLLLDEKNGHNWPFSMKLIGGTKLKCLFDVFQNITHFHTDLCFAIEA
ncbi:MAG: hypothetical protein ACJARW_000255 [Methylophilaceae bacterium]|jgi:hypothetical protein